VKNIGIVIALAASISTPVAAQSTTALVSDIEAPADGFCVVNASAHLHLFATETREGDRQLEELKPGGHLCADGTTAPDGIISVFENADKFEGCSRIIPVGTTETMLEYAEFDRCGWGSHKS
jgi:hypothetical protein